MEERSDVILTNDELFRILKLMEESDWDEIELTTKNFKFMARKSSANPSAAYPFTPPRSGEEKAHPVVDTKSDNVQVGSGYNAEATLSDVPKNDTKVTGAAIYAPMMGTFYRSSSPGVPPFVEAGDIVTEHTIVGIIEVMKVMSSVEAGLRGRISSILAENGKLVQYNQPLFLIEPEDRSAETTHE